MTYNPPVCPHCGEPILRVYETVYERYVFDPETGAYSHNELSSSMDIECGNCGSDLRDVFEEGACNYSAK